MPHLIRSACLTDYVRVAQAAGLDAYRMLESVRLPCACLSNPDLKIPAGSVRRLFEESARVSGVADFGLRLAETFGLSNLGPHALLVREQPSVRAAIGTLVRYSHLNNEALALRLEESGDVTIIAPAFLVGRAVPVRQSIQLSMGVLYRTLAALFGKAWRPQAVCFTQETPDDVATYRRIFGNRAEFGSDVDGIVCRTQDLSVPVRPADPGMARYVQHYLDTVESAANAPEDKRVMDIVAALLPGGGCTADRVARQLGFDRRTLHRHLIRHGRTFTQIVDSVRSEKVSRYLGNPERPMHSIAELLGFSGLSAFSRWFRGRFGITATAWRAANASPGAPALRV